MADQINPADHPHTDPGDGRTECDRCGKWVFPAIHSCKGVPVTAAARARWEAAHAGKTMIPICDRCGMGYSCPKHDPRPDPADAVATLAEASDDPEAFRLVYSALMSRYDDSCRIGHMTRFADEVAAHAVQVLRDAGRLLPPDTDTRPVFGVRMVWDDGTVSEDECERSLAEARVAYHAKRRAEGPWRIVSAEVVERTVITSAGPWRSVPTEETP